jgi:hypothetical protein
MAVRSFELESGSGPPSLAAMVIDLANFGKIRDIFPQRASFEAFRYSNALPILSCSDWREVSDLAEISNLKVTAN